MVLVSDDGATTWIVENPDSLIKEAGQHVVVNVRSGKHGQHCSCPEPAASALNAADASMFIGEREETNPPP